MEFAGETTLEHLSVEDAWLILGDPVSLKDTIPGCGLITKINPNEVDYEDLQRMARQRNVDQEPFPCDDRETTKKRGLIPDHTYGVYLEVGAAGLNLNLISFITVQKRSLPRMRATGHGIVGNYSFEMETELEILEIGDNTKVKWWLMADVESNLFSWGSTLVDPILTRAVNRFFTRVENLVEEHR